MPSSSQDLDTLAAEFSTRRSTLITAAYRLTGVRADAEDAVQEAWLRLSRLSDQERSEIRELTAWLVTVVGRICLDRLRSAVARREQYVGQWLPEPIVTPLDQPGQDPIEQIVDHEDVRMAAMVVLDSLSPEQRVAFVLHDALSVPFSEVAGILGCSITAARQHASRGRRALAEADPPPRVPLAEQQQLLEQFTSALIDGDIAAVTKLLHPEVALIGDADGKARTPRQIVTGSDKLTRFLFGLMRTYPSEAFTRADPMLVNGDLGLYLPPHPGDATHRAMDAHLQALVIRDGRITAIYDQANPDKLLAALS